MNYFLTIVCIAVLLGISHPQILKAQNTTSSPTEETTSPPSELDVLSDEETDLAAPEIDITKLTYQRSKLVSNVDFWFTLNFGLTGKNTNSRADLITDLATQRPEGSAAPPNESYEAINDSISVPYFIGVDFFTYYKFVGGGLSYYRLNYISGTQNAGVNITSATDTNLTNNQGSFNNYAFAYKHKYSLISDGFALEFHLRQKFINNRINLLFGLGYVFQAGTFKYDLLAVDAGNALIKRSETSLTSHGLIARLEMNFLFGYYLIRTGVMLMGTDFNTPYIENIPINIRKYNLYPYLSLGIGF
ncbi:hypothetical protein COTS27_01190 [Spirochaetota bacterium]|nr:hypothetical protein COTS27_01190 [Spirochaetota bacterium]